MKKLYFLLFTILISAFSFAQTTVFINEIHYDNSGGDLNEGVEIAGPAGTDLSTYTITAYNGSSTSGASYDSLMLSGSIPDEGGTGYGAVWFAISGLQNGSPDGIALDNGGALIQFLSYEGSFVGVGGVADGVTSEDIGVVEGSATLDTESLQLTGTGTTYENFSWSGPMASTHDLINTGQTFGTPVPTLALTDGPTDGSSVTGSPEDVNAMISFTTTNFTMSSDAGGGTGTGGDGFIKWYVEDTFDNSLVDSGNIFTSNDATQYPITGLMVNKTYYLHAELVDNSGNPLSSPVTYSINYTIPAYITVSDITAVRADVSSNGEGFYYEITGVSLVTHTDSYQNRQWVEDATPSGILIYDPDGISTTYTVGDNVTELKGQAQYLNGVLLLVPSTDSGVIQSSGNAVVPQTVTIAALNAAPDDYDSELIELQNVTFPAGDGSTNFSTGTNYDVTDGVDTIIMRTDFFGADYIGTTIPSTMVASLVAEGGQYNGTAQIYARSLSDFTLGNKTFDQNSFSVYPNPTSLGYVNIFSKDQSVMNVGVYDILGKQVINTKVSNNLLDVSTLTSGIYIMKISQDDASTTKKLVIK